MVRENIDKPWFSENGSIRDTKLVKAGDSHYSAITPARLIDLQSITSKTFKLFICDQETGKEGLLDIGDELLMRHQLLEKANLGSDVWLITPSGEKLLPQY